MKLQPYAVISAVRFGEWVQPKIAVVGVDLKMVALEIAVERYRVLGYAAANDRVVDLVERHAGDPCRKLPFLWNYVVAGLAVVAPVMRVDDRRDQVVLAIVAGDLKEKGIGINEIGIVAITHIHPDHVGWNVIEENGKVRLTFPKARYLIPKGDYDHFRQPGILEKAPHMTSQVLALEPLGAMEVTDGETSLTSEVTLVPTPGHTPGHVSVDIYAQGQRAFILGDVINFPAQAHETHWELIYDTDHKLARSTREAVLERLEKNGSVVGMGHFRPPSFGRLIRSESRRLWQLL